MFLQSISLQNFKNYEHTEATFCERFNCIVGLNGSGKTNLIDAIHYLAMTKSAFNTIDAQNIRHDNDYFVINSSISKHGKTHELHCSLKKSKQKTFKVDQAEYDKLSHHMGQFPAVLIAPNDDELIRDSNETRRKFFDSIIGQADPAYLSELIKYNFYLKQRNALLKSFAETGKKDKLLLESYNQPMIKGSLAIAKKRKTFLTSFQPHFENNYEKISSQKDTISIAYNPKALLDTFESDFQAGLEKDMITQRSNLGIHRDEFLFKINDFPLKKFGSQGQQKSFLISLKLAQFEFIKSNLGITPILLLDDIFDKLDDGRIAQLMRIIGSDQFGQLFITDAREERTKALLMGQFETIKMFRAKDQHIQEVE